MSDSSTLNTSSLPIGKYELGITAYAYDPANPNNTVLGFSNAVLEVIAPPPTVWIDSQYGTTPVSGLVDLWGWAVDPGVKIRQVQVSVDGVLVGGAAYGGPRPDVCAVYPAGLSCPNVGFSYRLDTHQLTPGVHTIRFTATDEPVGAGYFFEPPTWVTGFRETQFTVAARPQVLIDSLRDGDFVGGVVNLSGWAADSAATNPGIRSIQVLVDNTPLVTATYGTPNPEACVALPRYPACPNIGFRYSWDTNSLPEGAHIIRVIATNNGSQTRYAEVTVNVRRAAANISSQFRVTPGAVAFNRATGRYTQTAVVENLGVAVTSAAFVVDNLAAGYAVYQPAGLTLATAPTASPYREMGAMAAGARATLTLEFTRVGTPALTYTPRFLGTGLR